MNTHATKYLILDELVYPRLNITLKEVLIKGKEDDKVIRVDFVIFVRYRDFKSIIPTPIKTSSKIWETHSRSTKARSKITSVLKDLSKKFKLQQLVDEKGVEELLETVCNYFKNNL